MAKELTDTQTQMNELINMLDILNIDNRVSLKTIDTSMYNTQISIDGENKTKVVSNDVTIKLTILSIMDI